MEHSTITLIIMIASAVFLLFEIIPPSITAILCCLALTLTGILTPTQAFAQFSSPNIMLFAAMFVIGHAVFSSGLAGDIGALIQRFADSEKKLVLAVLIVSGGLSAFLSNTSTSAIFLPLIIGVAAGTGYNRGKLLYTMIVAVGMGGGTTFLGGPGWLFTKSAIENANPGTVVSMFELTKVGLPLLVISIVYMAVIGYKLIPVRDVPEEYVEAKQENKIVPIRKKQLTAVVTALTILCMLFASQIKMNASVIAIIGAVILVLTNVVTETEAYRAISWKTLILFGGLLPLSTALDKTGAGQMISDSILSLMGNTTNPYVITAVCMTVPCILSQFLSNATCMAIFTPLGISIAKGIGADPTAVIMAISIGSGIAIATPIGQPGNAMIYGPSGLRFMDYVKPGLPLTVILLIAASLMIPNVWPFFH